MLYQEARSKNIRTMNTSAGLTLFEVPLVIFVAFAAADELMDAIRKTVK
jgi:hypothetical protein